MCKTIEEKTRMLRKIVIGSVNAEEDNNLEIYFYETPQYFDVITGRKSIVTGPKGAGKSAIFRILQKRQGHIPEVADKILLFIDNPDEMRELQKFTDAVYDPGKMACLWETYIAAKIGERLISNNTKYDIDSSKIEDYLNKFNLYTGNPKRPDIIHRLFRYIKSIGLAVLEKGPRVSVELHRPDDVSETLNLHQLLDLIDETLQEINTRREEKNETAVEIWILFDRLDEVSPWTGDISRQNQDIILQTLMTSYSDLRMHDFIKLKIFIRDDIYNDLRYVNKDHFSDRRMELTWDRPHLLILLGKRISFYLDEGNDITRKKAEALFTRFFGETMEDNGKNIPISDYIFSRLMDGYGNISPRDFLIFFGKARDKQIDFFETNRENIDSLMSFEAVKVGLLDTSKAKLNEYLYNIYPMIKDKVENFRGEEKTQFSRKELGEILELESDGLIYEAIIQLLDAGFLKKVGKKSIRRTEYFQVAPIYRAAMDVG